MLVVTAARRLGGQYLFTVKCDCGVEKEIDASSIKKRLSCGCARKLEVRAAVERKIDPKPVARYMNEDGYILRVDPRSKKYVLEHRLVYEVLILKRPLRPEETVHHKNGIRHDNRPDNLELWASRHPVGQRVDDLVAFAVEILRDYAPETLSGNAQN